MAQPAGSAPSPFNSPRAGATVVATGHGKITLKVNANRAWVQPAGPVAL